MRENEQLHFRAFDGIGNYEVGQTGGFPVECFELGIDLHLEEEIPSAGDLQVAARSARSKARHRGNSMVKV